MNKTSDYYQKVADIENMGSANKPLQKLLKDRPTKAVEEAKKEESEEEISETEYYEENEELTCSPIEQERLQKQAATWSGQIDYNLEASRRNELQLIDIDEVYLIDIPRWGDPVTGLKFEEEIGQGTSI
ncbi:23687_t:CDS:2 [Gigaspora rosea]|nr:23687_t:CDS:2 [Gigaspora rosea]